MYTKGFPNVTKSLVHAAQIRCFPKLSLPVVEAQKTRYCSLLSSVHSLGRPGAAGVVGRDLHQSRRRPIHEVGGFPDDDGFAARVRGAIPIAI